MRRIVDWFVRVFWREQSTRGKVIAVVVAALVVLGLIGALVPSGHKGAASSGVTEPTSTTSKAASAPKPKARIQVVARQSWCAATGVDDLYTGNGHVTFFLTLRNTGRARGSVTLTPVRYYDDGADNRSFLDAVTVSVPAGRVKGGRTDAMIYKAHEHEVVRCAWELESGKEVAVRVTHG